MALAFLQHDETTAGTVILRADTGSNRFYRYKIGGQKSSIGGLEQIEAASHASPMLQNQDANEFSSTFRMEIPGRLLSRENRMVQLYSFRDGQGNGPAISQILEVAVPLSSNEDLLLSPAFSSAKNYSHMTMTPFNPCRSAAFSFQESRLSRGMFLDALLQVAGALAPQASQGIAQLLNSGMGGSGFSGDSILQVLNAVISALGSHPPPAGGAVASPPGAPAPAPPAAAPATPGIAAAVPGAPPPSLASSMSRRPLRVSQPFSMRRSPSYQLPGKGYHSRGMIFDGGLLTGPMLASVIGPMLQGAPQLIQAVGDVPLRLLAMRAQERMQRRQSDQDYILRLLSSIHQESAMRELIRLLASTPQAEASSPLVSASSAPVKSDPGFTAVFQKNNALQVNGKQKFVYRSQNELTLLLDMKTNRQAPERPIPKIIVTLKIKEPETLRPLLEKTFRFKDILLGSTLSLTIPAAEAQALPLQTDLLACAEFKWQGRYGKPKSLADQHLVFLVNEYWLHHVEDPAGAEIPLSDPVAYKVFWNKIWESPATGGRRWKAGFETKYYFWFKNDKPSNARVETRMKLHEDTSDSSEHKLELAGRLKSALELSPVELNKLLPRLGAGSELPPEKLAAFQTDELRSHFNLQASAFLEIKGKDKEQGSLWAFPEVQLRNIVLSKISQSELTGQVTQTAEETLAFPMPSSVHFVGAVTA